MQRAAWAALGFVFAASQVALGEGEVERSLNIVEAAPVTVFGRVEARVGASDDSDWSRRYDARGIFGVDFRHGDWLKGQVEMEVAALPELRDAWLKAKLPGRLTAKAGKFKTPFGRFEQSSRWDLPLVRRGAVSKQARSELGYGGRRIGLMLAAKAPKRWGRATLAVGVFEGDALSTGARAEDLVARTTANLASWLSVGAGAYLRGAFRSGASERFLASGDAWLVFGGFEWATEVQAGPEFAGATTLVAWRLESKALPGWWLQPAFAAELVRGAPDTPARPLLTPALNAGWNAFRARLAVEFGSARAPVGSARSATGLAFVGCEF